MGGSVAKTAEVEALFAQVKQQWGKVDILVNNAGIYAFSPIDQVTEEQIDTMFGVNVKGLLLATKAALPLFPAEGGSVIHISSTVTTLAMPASSVYAGTKGAVDVITRVLANELGSRKIRVNTVSPGITSTEGNSSFRGTELEQGMISQTPLGRLGQPEDIADVVTFLALEDARWITGEILSVSGGLR